MFLVEWRYSAISLVAVALLAIYIGKNKPLSHPGISEWSLHIATKNSLLKCLGYSKIFSVCSNNFLSLLIQVVGRT